MWPRQAIANSLIFCSSFSVECKNLLAQLCFCCNFEYTLVFRFVFRFTSLCEGSVWTTHFYQFIRPRISTRMQLQQLGDEYRLWCRYSEEMGDSHWLWRRNWPISMISLSILMERDQELWRKELVHLGNMAQKCRDCRQQDLTDTTYSNGWLKVLGQSTSYAQCKVWLVGEHAQWMW